jgi:serine/threonine protein kinase/tetratricopeptide (TPR) repeat protein
VEPSEWKKIKEVVGAALEREPSQRTAFLDEVCLSNPSLRAEVESLLSAYKMSPLSEPALTVEHGEERRIADSIGPYNLVRRIGEGGMGQVWLAEQISPVHRSVALKLIKAGTYDDSALRRFETERQLLANMDHPAIAKVFDAGATSANQPYFVMEYVPGTAVTEYCDRKKFTVAQRLDLFLRVCQGVQHAHQKAILHRDLKPSNILVVEVDGDALPRIIDFGLAKPLAAQSSEGALQTRIGGFVGTPGYMSPEQADPRIRDIDTRTDVYSMGVVLYQLLTGSLPFETAMWNEQPLEEVLRHLRENEPLKPSAKLSTDREVLKSRSELCGAEPRQLGKMLRGDLDWITMKALEKDRNRRYNSVADFASDIVHYLNHEPVLARPTSPVYRFRKYVRRHRVGAFVVATLIFLVSGLAALRSVQVRRITLERDRADREAVASKNVSDFLVGLFRVSDPSEARGESITAREILDQGRAHIATGLAGQPLVQARLMQTMGEVYEALGLYSRARPLLQQAVEIRRAKLGAEAPDTLASMDRLSENLEREGLYADAERSARETLEIRRRVLGPENADTIASIHTLASITLSEGHYAQSEQLDRDALAIDQRVFGAEHPLTLTTMSYLARALSEQGKHPEAERLLRSALEAEMRAGTENAKTLAVRHNLGIELRMSGQTSEAEKTDRENLEIRSRVLGPEHPETLASMLELAASLDDLHRYDEAEVFYRENLAAVRRTLGSDHPDGASVEYNLACNMALRGRGAEAISLLRNALQHGLPVRTGLRIEADSDLASLHGVPGFAELVATAHQRATMSVNLR